MVYPSEPSTISLSTLKLLARQRVPIWLVSLTSQQLLWANVAAQKRWGIKTIEGVVVEENVLERVERGQTRGEDLDRVWIFRLIDRTIEIRGITEEIPLGNDAGLLLIEDIDIPIPIPDNLLASDTHFDRSLIRLLTDFIGITADEINEKITEALAILGQFEASTHSYVFQFIDREQDQFSGRHEWCAEGEPSQLPYLQNLSASDFPQLLEKLNALEVLFRFPFSPVEGDTTTESARFLSRFLPSLIVIPLVYQNSLLGFVGFDTMRNSIEKTDNHLSLLLLFAEMLANALHRQRVEMMVREQQQQTTRLLNSLPGIVFKANNQDSFPMKFLSNGCYKITSYSPEELISPEKKSFNDIVHSEDYSTTMETIEQSLQKDNSYEVEYRIITQEGEQKWLWEKGIITNASQEIEGFITDITPLKVAEQALRDSEARYRLLAENVTDLISRHQPDGICLYASSACQFLLGYEGQALPKNFLFDLCHPEDIAIIGKFIAGIGQKLILEPIAYRLRHQDGEYVWLETTVKIIADSVSGVVTEFIAASRNINQRKQTEEFLRQAEEQYRGIFENINQGIFQSSADGRYLKVNPALARIYGYESPEALITHLTDIDRQLYVDLDRRMVFKQLLDRQNNSISNFESRVYRKDGTIIWISESTRAVRDDRGQFLYYEGTVEDITYRLRTEEKLLQSAFYDALTGLHNRTWFTNELQAAIRTNRSTPSFKYAILFIDLDGFKVINDSFGHLIGDELLQKVARRLQGELRSFDKIARFGGDEFMILIQNLSDASDAILVAQRLQERLKIPFQLSQETVFISASIGITTSDLGYQRTEDPIRDADIAMYRAKGSGKACHSLFSPEMQKAVLSRLQTENDLRHALEQREFRLYYQPIMALETGTITGFEALLRWVHPTRGMISPTEFIPIAEETGLIHAIGWWVLQESCYQLYRWKSSHSGAGSLSINVNLSAHQLKETELVKHIDLLLRKTGLEGHQLKLEITESAFLETIASKAVVVQQLKSFGLQLCIDDFGTGYSSLSRLHEFPIDTLKIDRSFINRLESNQTAIVQTILSLAQALGMNVVAEGIETLTQLEKLRHLGCEFGQGYLFSPPVPEEAAGKFLSEPSLLQSVTKKIAS